MTIEQLKRLAAENPVEFIATIRSAFDAVKASHPEIAKKGMWGETGVDPYDATAIMNALRNAASGDALASLIAGAIGGVDVNRAVQGDTPQVAATMRAAVSKFVAKEISANPTGELAVAVKSLIAPDVAKAISESIKMVLNGTGTANSAGFDLDGFTVPDGADPLAVEYPALNRPAR